MERRKDMIRLWLKGISDEALSLMFPTRAVCMGCGYAAGFESEMTKFVVAATSVTQLIYMSEIGSIIMGSKIPVSLKDLFIIFIERTIVTLPVIALFAHMLF